MDGVDVALSVGATTVEPDVVGRDDKLYEYRRTRKYKITLGKDKKKTGGLERKTPRVERVLCVRACVPCRAV